MMNTDIEKTPSTIERRRHLRYSAHKRALVAVTGDDFSLPYHLIDISEGGMAFRNLNENSRHLKDGCMDIYLNEVLCVGRLPVTLVADQNLMEEDDIIPKRRCSMRFGEITPAQKIQLQAFIQNHTSFQRAC